MLWISVKKSKSLQNKSLFPNHQYLLDHVLFQKDENTTSMFYDTKKKFSVSKCTKVCYYVPTFERSVNNFIVLNWSRYFTFNASLLV